MKKISSVKAYNTNATVFTTDGMTCNLDYDFQDRHFFDSQEEAEEWLKEKMTYEDIEYDADKLGEILVVLWTRYTK